jgi:hypothetical protein
MCGVYGKLKDTIHEDISVSAITLVHLSDEDPIIGECKAIQKSSYSSNRL